MLVYNIQRFPFAIFDAVISATGRVSGLEKHASQLSMVLIIGILAYYCRVLVQLTEDRLVVWLDVWVVGEHSMMMCCGWRWEAVLVYMVRLREEICSVRRAVASPAQPHRREALHVCRVLSTVRPQRPPRKALSSTCDMPWRCGGFPHAAGPAVLHFSRRCGINSVITPLSLRSLYVLYSLCDFSSSAVYRNSCRFWTYIQVCFPVWMNDLLVFSVMHNHSVQL